MGGLPLCLVLLLWGAVSVAGQPVACATKSDDGGLPETGGSIVSDKKEFYDASKVYPVRTFSDRASTGNTAEFCLRYEIENLGPNSIQNFYWGLPGIRIKELRPGLSDRQSRSKTIRSTKDPEVLPTTINAFANESATPKVWMIEGQLAQAEGAQFAEVVAVDPAQLLPADVENLLVQNAFPQHTPILAVRLDQEKEIYPVRETVSGNGFTLAVNSRAFKLQDTVIFQTEVVLSGDAAKEATILMPVLQALQDSKAASSIEYYSAFLNSVKKQGSEPIKGFTSRKFATNMSVDSLLGKTIFLSDHVITLRANDNEYCYRFQSYTPFAVDFDLDRCPE
ncbi:hypothetical protein [Rhizobium ruizarguesonis]|uniref:hypothetical protein n=1 Tax=Rhizobium ruizarguesonis TaxID=2081791 RepID=UPI00102F8D47|nr:hypothetical protein [Rhizobium ruizarguesonis]TBD80712.1 hypothetical protein ELH11_12810 [Rhizobium ruizarguesonis]TBE11873.1 hypothetical protein ELH09_12885 [Rhizobium ruizarguesonis]TBE23756.1 hypothetical protein ELH08_13115 [Rhizobium ruizarguesonis]TBE33597.1 hypothetical protein ELH07_13585 [Rhizobium ruizarguesonis]WSG99985.1 hypothetical protein U8P71_15320 [Rhizobium ruizarguesonis]